ncbi:MAG: hypothetical protein A3I77_03345 [Gammaproteobacteria bacterium RIFCSPLOWO2_02_FULL_42_14]|nr:MAG: hypothetical protein A3B71_01325 [Gammaproteobacteria bacterium RIFCSPHIGHO2_02_FULL_42_43]OGT28149.1 MAG: hypothetical protein A2624_02060 [Gammaproteobacteria bacterium RIFCSPHIGHO2_01_FULL_42_8]OGT51708.1 MAG: hypothetical protein A3E54_03540 [Gammaproteobacteria bacterium RIFCSPHIGHO2_12_FULL_41_25]OGT61605.1 MAG: hypothetical protein A3I77_03345 [Gammaproteobacteria bacterium RIFCSPLOWO2_02_FULL_42_14]OGT86229.1 MAG: hypothetical protein A3G86_06195 [Gammaproteobacteria bacterium R
MTKLIHSLPLVSVTKPIRLKKDADRRIKAGHRWIFSNDIDTSATPLKQYQPGEWVVIENAMQNPIAIGYINPHCLLCIRVITRNVKNKIDTEFFAKKMQHAKEKRELIYQEPFYRAVFGDSDQLSGVVIDRFDDVIVLQINTAGMENQKTHLIDAIEKIFRPQAIYLKCDSAERTLEGLEHYQEAVKGPAPDNITIRENHCVFQAPLTTGQKTGWFYDHRDNRQRIAHYCKGKRVLDVFSYCGAFAIPCKKAGATEVIAIDRAQSALDFVLKNAAANALTNISTHCGDAEKILIELHNQKELFDVVILDPPALIKRKKDQSAGEKMYQRLNELALQLLRKNGILFSASCSMHLSAEDLQNGIRRAGIQTKRSLSILEQCHQAADHPVHPAIAETNYLKGFIVHAQ